MKFRQADLFIPFLGAAFVLSLGAPAIAQSCSAPPLQATYKVTFEGTWSQSNHPADFPNGAHFSGMIGGTHTTAISFWDVGALASPGIESMAESGSKTLLTQEVDAQISAGNAGRVLSGSGFGSPGRTSMTFDITSAFPAVTIVSMIAPSPDWFVGVSGLELFQNGMWRDQVVVSLAPYDAGTDSGTMYTSGNSNTNPADPIFEILGYPFQGVPLGTFTFTKLASEDLALCLDPLIAGQTTNVHVTGGTPSETVAILWSTSLGNTQANSANWCVDFGIDFPIQNPQSQLVALGPFDAAGEFVNSQTVPAAAAGLTLYFQAAEMSTCPDTKMSNIVQLTVN
jgi:spondin N